jgi:hypothetical protein
VTCIMHDRDEKDKYLGASKLCLIWLSAYYFLKQPAVALLHTYAFPPSLPVHCSFICPLPFACWLKCASG